MTDDGTGAVPPADEQPATSRWEDYIDVFFSPVELFRRRAQDRVAPPLLTLLLLSIAFYFVLIPANRMIIRASLQANPQALEAMSRFETLFVVSGSVMVPITYSVIIAWAAGLLWLVGRFAEIRTDMSRTMLIATYAGFLYLLGSTLALVSVLVHGAADLDIARDISFGPLRFVGAADMNRVLKVVLGRFELFTLWVAVLWAVGIRVIYRVSTGRASVVAGVTWLLYMVPGLIAALLGIGGGPPAAQG